MYEVKNYSYGCFEQAGVKAFKKKLETMVKRIEKAKTRGQKIDLIDKVIVWWQTLNTDGIYSGASDTEGRECLGDSLEDIIDHFDLNCSIDLW